MGIQAYIIALGRFLPGDPIDNDQMEKYLGEIGGKASRIRKRVLRQNGIKCRYYAIDQNQKTLYSNSEMAASAVREAVARSGADLAHIDFIAAATSQGDLPLPGFASIVHGDLKSPPCEIATLHGVCGSGLMALKAAMFQVISGEKRFAVSCASEFASRLFKASRFDDQSLVREEGLSGDAEFLRWMLSDGAGAAVLAPAPTSSGLCLGIEWIDLVSYANRFEPCMYVGPPKQEGSIQSWLDYPTYASAADAGAINLRQDTAMLKEVVQCAVQGLLETTKKHGLKPEKVDWLAVHYSSNVFRTEAFELAAKAGFHIPLERWFSNLSSTGNVGSASTFLLLEELLYSGKLRAGDSILCLVPESGRFLFGYMLLKVVQGTGTAVRAGINQLPAITHSAPPTLAQTGDPLAEELIRELAMVWFSFEERLQQVPIVRKLNQGRLTLEDYRAFLYNLRQQVIEGSRWIARAASSITPEYFPIRSAFILHTSEEHRDFEMLERNYELAGGELDAIRSGRKNVGSEALSAYVLQKASQENPFELIGTMFIVEGIGQRIARPWGEKIQKNLGLGKEAVSFFLYHSESDVTHFKRLDLVIASGILTRRLVDDIVQCAKVTARLYALQLEEIEVLW